MFKRSAHLRRSAKSAELIRDDALSMYSTTIMCLALLMLSILSGGGCQSTQSVSGVWREVPINEEGEVAREISRTNTAASGVLYELNLGQFGDRVAGVSVRYRIPQSNVLASFDQGDRCGCAFIVQGLIETLEESEEDSLLFVAQGLTFSLYPPPPESPTVDSGKVDQRECPTVPVECRRIFDLELIDDGEVLVGETWCLDANASSMSDSSNFKRPVRFEPISGIAEDVCVIE